MESLLIAFVSILVDLVENGRRTANLSLIGLYQDIYANGLRKPLGVVDNGDDTYDLREGHRRWACINKLREHDPEQYERHFGDGIPITFLPAEATDKDRLANYNDHGNVKSLTRGDIALQWRREHHAGWATNQIARKKIGVLCDQHKHTKRTADPDKYGTELQSTKAQDDAYWTDLRSSLNGPVAMYAALARMPEAIYDNCVAILDDDHSAVTVNLTQVEMRALGPIWTKDADAGRVDKDGFTPNLREKWDEMLSEADGKRHPDKQVRASAKEAEKQAKDDKATDDKPKFDLAVQIAATEGVVAEILTAVFKGDIASIQSFNEQLKGWKPKKAAKDKASK
jgi:hypothetical protein